VTIERESNGLEKLLHLQELHQFVEKNIANQYLRDEFILPVISRLQLFLGAVVLSKSGLTQMVRERMLAAMIMIYHGLSLHEEVTEDPTNEEKKRQLTVLGGDYLSSLFYKLLADTEHIEMIRVFSRAIVHINEAKTSLHKALFDGTYNEFNYLSDVRIIHGALIQSLCDIFIPGEQTILFIDAALEASVYGQELNKHNEVKGKTLANVILGKVMSNEERRQFHALTQVNAATEKRYTSLHVKYDTFSHVVQGFYGALSRLKETSIDLFGAEGWDIIEQLFHPLELVGHEGRPYVERG
jgi:hypothetical protein